jgi:hypothetical protein
VGVLLQCAAFCTSLQSLLVGAQANSFGEAELHDKLSKSGLPIDSFLSKNRGVLPYLSYSPKDNHKVAPDMRRERGRIGCVVVKMVADAALEKDRYLQSSRETRGDYSLLLIPERVDFHIQSLLQALFVSDNVSNPAGSPQPSGNAGHVESLNLSGCNLRSSSHPALISVLQRLPALRDLNLSLNYFPADSILAILQEVQSLLETLRICNSGISGAGLLAAKSFSFFKFVSITCIDVSDNAELQAPGFAFLLQSCSVQNLIRLEASNCGIDLCKSESSDHLKDIVSIFRQATLLQRLDLSKNSLGIVAIEDILRSMSPDPQKFGCCRVADPLDFSPSSPLLDQWVSPLKDLNLSCTACEQVRGPSLTCHFDKWFNSILPHYSNLVRLDLSENQCLFNLNPSISCLHNLVFLDLSHCKNLLTIPDELILGTRSRKFDLVLVGCDALEYPPKKKADEGLDAMRRFVEGSEKTPLNHVKVVLLGNGGSGKRSLLCALANIRDSEHKSFDEINQLIRKQYLSRKSSIGSWFAKKLAPDSFPTLSFWNFGGQLEYSSHLNFYMSARQTVYVIVFSVVESRAILVQQISYWLRAVFDCSKSQHSIRILLIGSHIDAVHPSLLDKHKAGIRDLIDKLLVAMSVRDHIDNQIFLEWWFSADPRFPGHSNEVERITDKIFDTSSKFFQNEGLDVPLFPKSYLGMIKEVKKLADNCEQTKKFPLIKLADLTKEECEILAGSDRNSRKLDSIKVLSEVGILISYTDLQEEPWICVNLNFCVDVVTLFTNSMLKLKSDPASSHESIMSKEELYFKFKRFFETAVTSVSWYTSSLSQGYPESLFGFFVAQGLLVSVSALQFRPQLERRSSVDSELLTAVASDKTLFMIPLLLKGRPDSWREVFGHVLHDALGAPLWSFGLPIRIKGLRFSSRRIEFMITVSSFLKLMLGRCCDSRFMWGASFVYHVEGTSIFVRLAEDRHGIDVVTIGPEAPISAAIDLEIENIALELGLNERQSQRLCPLCCTSDDFVKSGTVRVYFQRQVDHYREFGENANCIHNHKLEASCLEEGSTLQMPAAPDAESSFFPNVCLANESL